MPIVLQVVGSLVRSKPAASDWDDDSIDLGPLDAYQRLQYCYRALPEDLQAAFQDIAVYFRGKDWMQVQAALSVPADRFNRRADSQQLTRLRDRSLIKDADGVVWMHDLLISVGCEAAQKSNSWAFTEDVSDELTEVSYTHLNDISIF